MFTLDKEASSTRARTGIFESAHGRLSTPAFFPVATQAALKGLSTKEVAEIGIDGLLVNAYHIFLRPGV
ncbi:MAG: tRNA-guanine transglycosylase, partial [Candidatus Omnitrophota bacterium]